MLATLKRLLQNQSGVTSIEYGLIAALIAVAAVTVMSTAGTRLTNTVSNVSTSR